MLADRIRMGSYRKSGVRVGDLPIGSKIKFGTYSVEVSSREPIIWIVAGKNHYRDTLNPNIAGHVTLITEKIIDLKGFDAKEPSNSDTNRQKYGNNRYLHSNLRQWLNKKGYPWYTSQHGADEPPTDGGMGEPTGYDDESGFLSNFSESELVEILNTSLTVAKNTTIDGGGTETVVDKVFLPSTTELGLANEPGGAEGIGLPLFSVADNRLGYMTQQAFINNKSASKPSSISDPWYYWLRSPYSSSTMSLRLAGKLGPFNFSGANNGFNGIRPALNLKSSVSVSDIPDEDGCYVLV